MLPAISISNLKKEYSNTTALKGIMESVAALVFDEKNNMLLLRRAAFKKTYPNKWDTLVGKREEGESIKECLLREMKEEIGEQKFTILQQFEKKKYSDEGREWFVHLFRIQIQNARIVLNAEHSEFKWLPLSEVMKEDCSLPLKEDLKRLLG